MNTKRYIQALAIPLAATIMALTSANTAHADADGYLNALQAVGAPTTRDDVTQELGLGYSICDSISMGWTVPQIITHIESLRPDVSASAARFIVTTAHTQLCPDA